MKPATRTGERCTRNAAVVEQRKGKEYCKPACRFAQWDKDHPRMVRWK